MPWAPAAARQAGRASRLTQPAPSHATQVKDASLLRFLVDMRDADLDNKQMRDDLMTMLIAGGARVLAAEGPRLPRAAGGVQGWA